jgi:hypothetical protein
LQARTALMYKNYFLKKKEKTGKAASTEKKIGNNHP